VSVEVGRAWFLWNIFYQIAALLGRELAIPRSAAALDAPVDKTLRQVVAVADTGVEETPYSVAPVAAVADTEVEETPYSAAPVAAVADTGMEGTSYSVAVVAAPYLAAPVVASAVAGVVARPYSSDDSAAASVQEEGAEGATSCVWV
jgi:hypothetical protein